MGKGRANPWQHFLHFQHIQYKRQHSKQRFADCTGFPSFRGKLVQAADFWYALCKGSGWLHTVLLQKLDTADDSCLVLPRTLTNRRYWFLCLLHAAQLPSQSCVLYFKDINMSLSKEPMLEFCAHMRQSRCAYAVSSHSLMSQQKQP